MAQPGLSPSLPPSPSMFPPFPFFCFKSSEAGLQVKEQGPAEVLSSACPSSWAEVAYYFKASLVPETPGYPSSHALGS